MGSPQDLLLTCHWSGVLGVTRCLSLQAVEQLDAIAASDGAAPGDLDGFLAQALLRRLADEEPRVALAALRARSLSRVPAAALADALETLLAAAPARAAAAAPGKPRKAVWAVTKQVQHCSASSPMLPQHQAE